MKIVQQWGLVALVGLSACQTQAPVKTNPQTGIKYQPELALTTKPFLSIVSNRRAKLALSRFVRNARSWVLS